MSLPSRPTTFRLFKNIHTSQCPSCSARRLAPISRLYHTNRPVSSIQSHRRLDNIKPLTTALAQIQTNILNHARSFSSSPSPSQQQERQEPYILSPTLYHSLADQTMDSIFANLEALAEKDNSIDVEFSMVLTFSRSFHKSPCQKSGVLTLTLDDRTYVINKQPPNKQIWLSSPVSGPKRFDWVFNNAAAGSGDESKEGRSTGSGEWVYARDGTTMNEILCDEVGVGYDVPEDEA